MQKVSFKQFFSLNAVKIPLGKRQKIIAAVILIMFGFLITTQTTNIVFTQYQYILAMGFVSFVLSVWALWEGLNKTKAVVLFILPVMFTIAATSFYFLLPITWSTRLPSVLVFGFLYYCLLLAQNVFNVASNRTIPLYRAASTVSFLFTLITAFFLFNVIFGFSLPFYWNALVIFLITFPLTLQVLWTVEMEKVSGSMIVYSIVVGLLSAEFGVALSFWPVAPTIWSLFLSASLYLILGVLLEFLRERLNRRMVLEYIGVGVVVILISIFGTTWLG